MLTKDAAALMKALAEDVRDYFSAKFELISARMTVLEGKAALVPRDGRDGPSGPTGPQGPQGEKGLDGKDGPAGRDGVDGKDGRDGLDGKDGAPGLDGANGRDGKDGEPGVDGVNGLDGKDGTNGLDGAIGPVGPVGPVGEPGPAGPAGEKGVKGDPGERGPQGEKGIDGISVSSFVIDADGYLIGSLTDGKMLRIGRVVGERGERGEKGINGIDGTNGRDGVSPDELDWDFDAATRAMTVRWVRDGVVISQKTKKILGNQIYRGVFSISTTYDEGDTVTWGGSQWHAKQTGTGVKPDEHTPDGKRMWQLIVKRGGEGKPGQKGLDGKDGRNGKDYEPPPGGRKW